MTDAAKLVDKLLEAGCLERQAMGLTMGDPETDESWRLWRIKSQALVEARRELIALLTSSSTPELLEALLACQYELVCLAPRLTPQFSKNAMAAADLAKAAIAKAKAVAS